MERCYSVLMPLAPWENPAILRRALDSISCQTLSPSAVVISCDGLPPRELRSVLIIGQLPLRLVIGPGGEGVGLVLARGLELCPTELIVRADADDLCLPHRCAQQIRTLLDCPELTAISASVGEFEQDPSRLSGLRRLPQTPQAIRRCSRWRNPLNHPAAVFRRSAILAVGNYRHCPGFEDYDLWLRLLKAGFLLGNHPDILVLCRTGPSHLARRHGYHYTKSEARFLLRCAREGLLPWRWVAIGMLTRLPLRLLPASFLRIAMGWLRLRPSLRP